MMTDPIADMLTRVRNAVGSKHRTMKLPASGIKVEIARILKDQGYINDFEVVDVEGRRIIDITLRYGPTGERVISNIRRVSRSGRRVYVKKTEIPVVLGGLGISIISTPQGLMTGQESRRRGLGGEVLCHVW